MMDLGYDIILLFCMFIDHFKFKLEVRTWLDSVLTLKNLFKTEDFNKNVI